MCKRKGKYNLYLSSLKKQKENHMLVHQQATSASHTDVTVELLQVWTKLAGVNIRRHSKILPISNIKKPDQCSKNRWTEKQWTEDSVDDWANYHEVRRLGEKERCDLLKGARDDSSLFSISKGLPGSRNNVLQPQHRMLPRVFSECIERAQRRLV